MKLSIILPLVIFLVSYILTTVAMVREIRRCRAFGYNHDGPVAILALTTALFLGAACLFAPVVMGLFN